MPHPLRLIAMVAALAVAGSASVGTYTVRRGDTLAAIAARNHTTIAALAAANGITNADLIAVGRNLRLDRSTADPASTKTITVRAGDTLGRLAARYHTTVDALQAANHLADARRLQAGTTLVVPGNGGADLPTKLISATAPVANPGFYVVQPNDTVASVAARFGVSAVALAAANGVIDNRLYIGARIGTVVSSAGQPTQTAFPYVALPTHIVRAGDTLARVAKAAHVKVAALAAINGLAATANPPAGSRLVIPGSWTCPVKGTVSFMNDWGFPRPGPTWHEGIDLMAKRGTPVVAPVTGQLVRDPNPKGGNAFNLYGDDGVRYYGAHLDHYGSRGRVKAGTVIGYVGNTGDADGGPVHLHFEIHPSGGPAVPPYPTVAVACP